MLLLICFTSVRSYFAASPIPQKTTEMKKQFACTLQTLWALLLSLPATAQDGASLEEFMKRLPQPPATLQQAMEKQPGAAETLLKDASRIVQKKTSEDYRPLYIYFLKTLESGQSNSPVSETERMLYRNYTIGSKGLSVENQYLQFQLILQDRPLLGTASFSWSLPGKFTGAEKDFYLQVLAVEKMFDHSLFKPGKQTSKLDFGGSDPVLNAIHKKFNHDFMALPKRRVKTPEGFNLEVEDPDKAITAYKKYGQQLQEHFDQAYATDVASWQLKYTLLLVIAEKLDALAGHTSADKPMNTVLLSDLQGRGWDTAANLVIALNKLWEDVLIAQLGQKQVQDAIDIYSSYKTTIH